MLLQWGATACPAAVGKHGMRSFVLLQAHFCGVGNAVMCELPGEEREHGWNNTAGPAREVAEKKNPVLFTGHIHRPALVPIRIKGLSKCHSPVGQCQSILILGPSTAPCAASPRQGALVVIGGGTAGTWLPVQSWLFQRETAGEHCRGARFVQPSVLGAVPCLGRLCCSCWGRAELFSAEDFHQP